MEQLERPAEEVWDERRLWFEEQEAQHARHGAQAPSEQACALMIDLQAVFCAGAWAAVVILACAVTEAQGGSRRESLPGVPDRSEEHTSELQSLMRISYAAFCLKTKTITREI